jgi:hypothetical protein
MPNKYQVLSDSELTGLLTQKRKEVKNGKQSSGGIYKLEELEKEQVRRKSKDGSPVKLTKDSPNVASVVVAIKQAAKDNKCQNVDVIKYCVGALKTGHSLVKNQTKPRKKAAKSAANQ